MITKFRLLDTTDLSKALVFYRKNRANFNMPVEYHEQCPQILIMLIAYSLIYYKETSSGTSEEISGHAVQQMMELIKGADDISRIMKQVRKPEKDLKLEILETLQEAKHKSCADLIFIMANMKKYGNSNLVQEWLISLFCEEHHAYYSSKSVWDIFVCAMDHFKNLKDDPRIASLKQVFESQYGPCPVEIA